MVSIASGGRSAINFYHYAFVQKPNQIKTRNRKLLTSGLLLPKGRIFWPGKPGTLGGLTDASRTGSGFGIFPERTTLPLIHSTNYSTTLPRMIPPKSSLTIQRLTLKMVTITYRLLLCLFTAAFVCLTLATPAYRFLARDNCTVRPAPLVFVELERW